MAGASSTPAGERQIPDPIEMAARFRALHETDGLFVLPNPYDVGTAKLLDHLGFEAMATTSAGLARTLGRPDAARAVSRAEALDHARLVVEAVGVPVTGDFEDGFALDPEGVAATIVESRRIGLAGCCIEDATYDSSDPIMDVGLATERIRAAAEAAHADEHPFVLTARSENLLYGWRDLDEAIVRLQAYAAAGADAVYAPGLVSLDDIRRVVESVDKPVNVLVGLRAQDWTLEDLRVVGVRRVSVGSALSKAAFGAVLSAARCLLDEAWSRPGHLQEVVQSGDRLPDLDALFSAPQSGSPAGFG
jgi:2-methylisocitrate lyase-like PEP mutase family enzyme